MTNTPTEIRAIWKVVETVTIEALRMALVTPAARRPAEMLAIHATIPDRLIVEGVDALRAIELARGIRITVEVAADEN